MSFGSREKRKRVKAHRFKGFKSLSDQSLRFFFLLYQRATRRKLWLQCDKVRSQPHSLILHYHNHPHHYHHYYRHHYHYYHRNNHRSLHHHQKTTIKSITSYFSPPQKVNQVLIETATHLFPSQRLPFSARVRRENEERKKRKRGRESREKENENK